MVHKQTLTPVAFHLLKLLKLLDGAEEIDELNGPSRKEVEPAGIQQWGGVCTGIVEKLVGSPNAGEHGRLQKLEWLTNGQWPEHLLRIFFFCKEGKSLAEPHSFIFIRGNTILTISQVRFCLGRYLIFLFCVLSLCSSVMVPVDRNLLPRTVSIECNAAILPSANHKGHHATVAASAESIQTQTRQSTETLAISWLPYLPKICASLKSNCFPLGMASRRSFVL